MNTLKTTEVVKLLDTNKAKVAFLAPILAAVLTSVGSWVVSGDFNDTEIRAAVAGVLYGAAAGVGTYLTGAGNALVRVPPGPE